MKNWNVRGFLPLIAAQVAFLAIPLRAQTTWVPTVSGTYDWNVNSASAWSSGTFPNATGATVLWSNLTGSGTQTVQLQENITVGSLTFGDATGAQVSVTITSGSSGTAVLNFDNTAGNAVLVSQGSDSNQLSALMSLTDTVAITASSNLSLAGGISGTGGLTKSGAGVLTLSGSNSFTGGVTVTQGRLNVNSATAVGTGALALFASLDNTSGSAVTLSTNNAIALNTDITFVGSNDLNLGTGSVALVSGATRAITVSTGTLTIGGAVSGVSLQKAGAGTLVLNGSNTYSGTTFLSAGTLEVTSIQNFNVASSIGALSTNNTGSLQFNGGTLSYTGATDASTDRRFQIGATTGGIASNGTGTLTFSNTLTAGSANPQTTAKVFTLSGSNTGSNTIAVAFVDPTSSTTAITKSGAGRWILSGNNTYTGATTVTSGTLVITGSLGNTAATVSGGSLILSGAGTTGTGAVAINSGGALGAAGSSSNATIGGITTVASGGVLGTVNATIDRLRFSGGAASVLDVSGAVSGANTGGLIFQLAANGVNDSFQLTNVGGSLNIGSGVLNWDDFSFSTLAGFTGVGTYTLFDTNTAIVGSLGSSLSGSIGGNTGTLSILGGQDLILTVVPEPQTSILLGVGIFGMLHMLRRRRI